MMRAALPIARLVADFALPPRCPGCGTPVGEDHRFCAACWSTLEFLGPPWCAGCNAPFAFDRGPDALCGACLDRRPVSVGVRAAVAYGDVARRVALRLKYAGRTGFATAAARMMVRLVPEDAAMLVPVPLHRWRLWSRGYNQAGLIAAALARLSGVPAVHDALLRRRATATLRGLSGRERRRVVRAAFEVPDPGKVRGRAVLLIDDVLASGATAEACTRALLAAGATSVTILCWARVVSQD
jgi:ComF family protein